MVPDCKFSMTRREKDIPESFLQRNTSNLLQKWIKFEVLLDIQFFSRHHVRIFRSTHPYRVRLMDVIGLIYRMFRPTHPRIGCDRCRGRQTETIMISIHAHPYRVRLASPLSFVSFLLFRSTHPYKVRLGIREWSTRQAEFRSTHP